MNRAQRRKVLQMREKKTKPKNNAASIIATGSAITKAMPDAQGIIDNLPIPAIVAGINNLLSQLENRRIPIYNWDDPAQRLYRLQMRRGKIYFLAAGEEKEE